MKKAYADMIFSTAKEAAARVMASDRRASNYQNELLMMKEEAVRLLLRLKHMSDAKVSWLWRDSKLSSDDNGQFWEIKRHLSVEMFLLC